MFQTYIICIGIMLISMWNYIYFQFFVGWCLLWIFQPHPNFLFYTYKITILEWYARLLRIWQILPLNQNLHKHPYAIMQFRHADISNVWKWISIRVLIIGNRLLTYSVDYIIVCRWCILAQNKTRQLWNARKPLKVIFSLLFFSHPLFSVFFSFSPSVAAEWDTWQLLERTLWRGERGLKHLVHLDIRSAS